MTVKHVSSHAMELSHNFFVTGNSSELETNFFYPVRLDEGFELALSYFFCGPICNVNNEVDLLYLVKGDGHGMVVEERLIKIPHDYYHTTGELIGQIKVSINNYMDEHEDVWGTGKVKVEYNIQKRVWTLVLPKKQNISIAHNKAWGRDVLNLFTGLDEGNYLELTVVEAVFDENIESVFIYSSVVQESYIDIHQSRLLAIVPLRINTRFTQYEPRNLRFYKIAIEEFSSIFIELRNSRGNLIEFASTPGKCSKVVNGLSLVELMGKKCDDKYVILGMTLRNLYK